jgi:hypothetical protein
MGTLASHNCKTVGSNNGSLVRLLRKHDRQRNTECSSLTLKREEHLRKTGDRRSTKGKVEERKESKAVRKTETQERRNKGRQRDRKRKNGKI